MPYVPDAEFRCLTSTFASAIMLGPVASPSPIPVEPLHFAVGDLAHIIPSTVACDSSSGSIRGVVFHYGLNGRHAFDVAVEPVCLKPDSAPDSWTIEPSGTWYRLMGGRLVEQHTTLASWDTVEGRNYATQVVLQLTTDSAYAPFRQGRDVTSTTFRFDGELDRLIAQNRLADTDTLELLPTCIAGSRTATKNNVIDRGQHQGICVVPAGIALNDSTYGPGHEFKAKAADMGTSCPPNCIQIEFQAHGLERKPGC